MYCMICKNSLTHCTCGGLEERLNSCANFTYKMCNKCKKHYERCKCKEPDWIVKGLKQEIP